MTNILVENGYFIQTLARLQRSGGESLKEFPDFIKLVIRNRAWEGWVDPPTQNRYSQPDFETFITTPVLEGIGSTVQQVKDLCRHDKEALDLVIEWTTKKPGAPVGNTNAAKEETNADNISNCSKPRNEKHGTSLDYTLRRLRKEAPELLEKVINGEVTANKAAIEAGFRKKTMTVPADVEGLAKYIKQRFTTDQINQLVAKLISVANKLQKETKNGV